MKIRYFPRTVAFALVLAQGALADCKALFAKLPDVLSDGDVSQLRKDLTEVLQREKIPAFLKQTRNGEIPVILMNKNTVDQVHPYVDRSMGTQIYLQPDWTNDHGGMRLTNRLIDADLPGARGYGELHATGLSWKPIDSYVARGGNSVILEVSYALTAKEQQAAEYYHRARRGALYRVPFTFGGGGKNAGANALQSGGEHCFVFCKGSAVTSHLQEMSQKVSQAGVPNVAEFMASASVQDFLANAREAILTSDAYKAKSLGPDTIMNNPAARAKLEAILPAALKAGGDPARDFGNLLVGLDSATGYYNLLSELKVSSSMAVEDMNNPRATAILVYGSTGDAKSFMNATYQSPGKFYSWRADGQRPLPPAAPKAVEAAPKPVEVAVQPVAPAPPPAEPVRAVVAEAPEPMDAAKNAGMARQLWDRIRNIGK